MITTISLKYASKKMVHQEGVVAYTLQIYQNILSFEILITGDDFPQAFHIVHIQYTPTYERRKTYKN